MMYKVAKPGGGWQYGFCSLRTAAYYAEVIFQRTGIVAAVEAYNERKQQEP